MAIHIELRAHASIQRKANCPRTSYSGVNCLREESWGRDSLLPMGTAFSEATCPRGTGCSGVKCPRTSKWSERTLYFADSFLCDRSSE